jgi:hypothetical protein
MPLYNQVKYIPISILQIDLRSNSMINIEATIIIIYLLRMQARNKLSFLSISSPARIFICILCVILQSLAYSDLQLINVVDNQFQKIFYVH